MKVVQGDLFTSNTGAIGHGVNVYGAMGAGIARIFRQKFPDMYEEYRDLCKDGSLKPGGVFPWQDPETGLWVYNIASQEAPGPDARIEWLATGAAASLDHLVKQGLHTLCLPKIGCGIGGLDIEDVKWTLEQVERNRAASFEVWDND